MNMDEEARIESDEDDIIQKPKNNRLKMNDTNKKGKRNNRDKKMELLEQDETRNGIVRNDFRASSELVQMDAVSLGPSSNTELNEAHEGLLEAELAPENMHEIAR